MFFKPWFLSLLLVLILGAGWFLNQTLNSPQESIPFLPTEPVLSQTQNEIKKEKSISHESVSQTELKAQSLEVQEFIQFTEKVYQSLPFISDFQRLSESEVHHTPALMIEAGEKLGEIAQALEDHPEWAESAIPFYTDCARNDQFPNPVRALCYYHLNQIKNQNSSAFIDASVPVEVRSLAEKLE